MRNGVSVMSDVTWTCLVTFHISMVAFRLAIYLRLATAEVVIGHRRKRRTSKTGMSTFRRTLARRRDTAIEPDAL